MTNFPESGDTAPVQVQAGHAAVFSFPSITSEPSPSVSWQSEDNSLLYGTKYAVTRDNSLVILDVDKGDEKRYRLVQSCITPPDITVLHPIWLQIISCRFMPALSRGGGGDLQNVHALAINLNIQDIKIKDFGENLYQWVSPT